MSTVVRGSAETISFAYMNIGATHMLDMAGKTDKGQLYNLISCIIFCAFTLEAYFNHLGAIKYGDWIKKETRLSKLKKYKKFCDDLDISCDFNVRPYSTLTEVFRFRDTMAHGKTSVDEIEKEMEIELGKINHFSAGAEWKEYATLANAKKALNDVHELIKELHQAENLGNNPFDPAGGALFFISHT